ncbi:MAG: 16S rRNA (cytidine(1402)-2'-O)-methyltransferase [Gammaproteobacteria bacterium HGW-Gammaproteobacteria-4]|jgi:16S rRNA (cytidine1402-2'-O)-methyltransferase|nr:MAG: 16S rRNA (cytidine(1402)-2'-O)-methyltransferase [Gammaproteobacteria bacterium HGW-Gammaproteobacteria-4]
MQHSRGNLFVVSTPIGNLGDISARALETLRSVDLICAEDTRHSRQLLAHFGIERPLQALHEHNEAEQAEVLVARLLAGESMALVSDAGTPLLSDPGFRLVRAARTAGVTVSPVPGASALLAALAVSGQPCDRFCFEGFLPAKAAARRERLNQLVAEPRTLVFYESAHRIEAMLDDLLAVFGADRQITLARELTKLYETVLNGSVSEVHAQVAADPNQRRGEFVLVVAGAGDDAQARLIAGRRLYTRLCEHLAPAPAARLAAELSGAPRKALYGGDTD